RFYLMVRSFERKDRDASTRVPLAPGGGESTAWLGFGSRRTSPSRARSAASRSSVRRPASWPSCASASTTRSRACDGRRRRWPRASAPSVARLAPPVAAQPLGWAVVFVGTWVVAALLGRIAERLASALLLGGFNRVAGMLFGSAKAAALMGFTLLLIERAAPASAVSQKIAESKLGRPLERMAGTVAEAGHALGILPGEQHA